MNTPKRSSRRLVGAVLLLAAAIYSGCLIRATLRQRQAEIQGQADQADGEELARPENVPGEPGDPYDWCGVIRARVPTKTGDTGARVVEWELPTVFTGHAAATALPPSMLLESFVVQRSDGRRERWNALILPNGRVLRLSGPD